MARYASALREGGSLPALVETDGGEMMVAKWRGAGQGVAVLVAEVISGELARAAGFNMPELAVLELDPAIGKNERDEEVRDLLIASEGANLGMRFLEGALAFDPAAHVALAPGIAAKLVLFDSIVMNVDRTARNTNLLWWNEDLWLIDHGASLYWHHGWDGAVERPTRAFPMVGQHVLLPVADGLDDASDELQSTLTQERVAKAVAKVPTPWLGGDDATARRDAYIAFLMARIQALPALAQEATDARAAL
ncbi:MAG: aminotransferase class I and II [Nannocystaceae bacterium]|nr:aminotransferase class I and II [Nannocystaceae bacterium]